MSIKYKKSDRSSRENCKEKVIVIDYETKSKSNLKKVGAGAYSEHPSTEVIVLGFKFLNEKKIYFWTPDQPIPAIFKNHKGPILAHNYKFEYWITKNVMPPLLAHWYDLKNYRCTAATALRCGLPQKLEKISNALKLKNAKLTGLGADLINKFSKPKVNKKTGLTYFNPILKEDFQKFCLYNQYDLLATEEIYNILPKLHEDKFESPIFELDKIMSCNGIKIDLRNTKKLIKAYESYQKVAYKKAERLCGLTDGGKLVVNSPIAFKNWLNTKLDYINGVGIFAPNTQAFTLNQIEKGIKDRNKSGKHDKKVLQALELRKILSGTAEKKLYRLRDMVMKSGIIPDSMQYYGGHTGRGAGRGIQPHNFFRGSSETFLKDVKELSELKTKLSGTPLKFKKLLRQLLVASRANKFLIGDFSAIEAKITFWLSGCTKGLDLYHNDIDPYIDMAARIYRKKYEKIVKEERNLGKKSILSLGFGGGHLMFKGSCFLENIIVSENFSQKVVNLYRNTYPEIKKMWYDIEGCFRKAITEKGKTIVYKSKFTTVSFKHSGNSMKVTLPSGRIMYYFLPQIGKSGQIKYVNGRGFLEKTWGGSLCENIIQATARDLMFLAMVESAKNPLMFPVFTVHDEIINICKTKDSKKALKEFEKIMCTIPDWAKDLPAGAECVISDRYIKF